MKHFALTDFTTVFTRAEFAGLDVILVGGQAVNFYAARYRDELPPTALRQPFVSKDADLLGTMDDGMRLASALNIPWVQNSTKGGMRGLALGHLTLQQPANAQVEILGWILGASSDDVRNTAILVEFSSQARLKVIHPMLLYMVKGNNVVQLSQNEAGRERQDTRQFSIMTAVVGAILKEIASKPSADDARTLVKTCGRLLDFWLSRDGAVLVAAGAADPARVLPTDAMRTHPHESVRNLLDKRLPVFFEQQLPRAVGSAVPRAVEKVRADFQPFAVP